MTSVLSGHVKWARQGSNLRPIGYEPTALPLSYRPTYEGESQLAATVGVNP